MSPHRAIRNFIHAAELPATTWDGYRGVALPGLTVSVQAMVDTLRDIAGAAVVERIRWQPDPFIQSIVGSWPARFNPTRGQALGFQADGSMREIIEAFVY